MVEVVVVVTATDITYLMFTTGLWKIDLTTAIGVLSDFPVMVFQHVSVVLQILTLINTQDKSRRVSLTVPIEFWVGVFRSTSVR